jgi:hypothetical protein
MTTLTRLILRLGRNPDAGFPEGDDDRGYVLVAPIGKDGKLDAEAWRPHKSACTVRRFTQDHRDDAEGWLSHRGNQWSLRYDDDDEGPDEALFRLGDHRLFIGDYVTIEDPDGQALVYRVSEAVSVKFPVTG